MKKKILLPLFLSITLIACFDQNTDDCSADMHLTFSVDDPYEPGTYNTRLGSDVMLYIFKDKRMVSGTLIPYEKISAGKEYVIRKDYKHSGNLDLVAWAVPADRNGDTIPKLSIDDNLDGIYRSLERITRAPTDFLPTACELHLARLSTVEVIDKETKHDLKLNYSDCRMEVRVTDRGKILSQTGNNPKAIVYGTMASMDMDRKGVGDEAAVHATLHSPPPGEATYTTGRFGVLPSQEGQIVSVKIVDGTTNVVTLTVPRSALPMGAVSGGLLLFEYTLNASEFTLTVDGFRQNIVIIDDM